MNFGHYRTCNRRVVVCAGQNDTLLFSGERIDHHSLKFWRDDLIVFGEKKNCGDMNSFRVGDAIEFVWNSQRNWSGQKPQVPPAVVAQNYLAQWRRIVKNKTADFPIGRDVHRYRATDARTKNDDRLVSGFRLQCIEGRESGRRHSFQTRWAGAAAEAGIIHSPDFDGAFAEGVGFERDPPFGSISVAVETQNVGIDAIALLCDSRTRGPDFEFAILEWNGFSHGAMRIDPLGCGKKNQLIG